MLINQSHHAFAVFDKQAGRCVRSRDTVENRHISNTIIWLPSGRQGLVMYVWPLSCPSLVIFVRVWQCEDHPAKPDSAS